MYSDTLQRRCVFTIDSELGCVLDANDCRMSGVSSCLRRVQAQDPPTPSLLLLRGERNSFSLVCYHSPTFWAMFDLIKILGGEFSSLYQNTFHHYRDFWCFDITTRSWDRIETKVRPSARSGHRFDFPCVRPFILLFSNKPNLEWRCGNTTSSSSVDFTIRASLVSVSEPVHSPLKRALPSTIYE